MAPKEAAEAGKRKKEMILLKVKKEIIRKHEGRMRLTDLAKEYGRSASTIATILNMKEKITVEKLLLLWIEEKQHAGDTVSKAIICKNAKALHADLLDQQPEMLLGDPASAASLGAMTPETLADAEGFNASRGWFETRSGIHIVVRHGKAVSFNVAGAEKFATEFLEVIVSEGYLTQQVFNCDKTGLFWKRMPKRTFVTEEETSLLPGHKPLKDRLTLMFCANASGTFKVKPLLVYSSENLRAFKKHKVNKEQLSVLWWSNPNPWITRLLFVHWVNMVFGPAVKHYLVDNNLPLKAARLCCLWTMLRLILQDLRKTCWRTLTSSQSCSFCLTPPTTPVNGPEGHLQFQTTLHKGAFPVML
ncbi:tigger transposable element-derived 1-like [Pelobates cultripes]|uniref:Tigger transposable element-derived 1-like n=1 Tax=Pelobates cultripes TaxID=61616 RepID=A0AAD1RCK6_PELCU|nr:tigger transposable element-derived 1-like [Pelobates cultripes]